jgi:selenide, water dikinase
MVRLTQYSHGGGCGCKIAPAKLQEILQQVPLNWGPDPSNLLVGTETSDDAAVYQLNPEQALVLTTDFFMPIVDDPEDFGRIAATNAISDIYAMGGQPLLALTILGMPIDKLPTEVIQAILQGGAAVCRAAGIPLAGGHSIDSPEPIFGLVVAGIVSPQQLKRNATAQPGDRLILTKPLGIGVITTALKKEKLSPADYAEALAIMTQLNRIGARFADHPQVHAMTDVTGFGLLGHLLELCRGSNVTAQVQWLKIPFLSAALNLAAQGIFPGAARRNWDSYAAEIALGEGLREDQQLLLADPQTSGGLLLAVAPEAVAEVLRELTTAGYARAAEIGYCHSGAEGMGRRIEVLA